jgi:hypothetical protein
MGMSCVRDLARAGASAGRVEVKIKGDANGNITVPVTYIWPLYLAQPRFSTARDYAPSFGNIRVTFDSPSPSVRLIPDRLRGQFIRCTHGS